MKEATIISISAIQVQCPECGGLCKSTFTPAFPSAIHSSDETPFISLEQENKAVECLLCQKQFALPRSAFVAVDLRHK